MNSMKRRADGRWQKRVKLPNGKSKLLYSSASTERLATKDFNEQMLKMDMEQEESEFFQKVAEKWKSEHFPKMQNNTLKQYKPALKEAIGYFSDQKIVDIKPIHIKQYIDYLSSKNYALKTVKNRLLVVSLIFNYASLCDIVSHNPCTKIKIPASLPKTNRQKASLQDEQKILQNANLSLCGTLAYLYLTTGCRRGEALALTPDDVDLENNYIHINKTVEWIGNKPQIKYSPKTESGVRNIPISDKLSKLLVPLMKSKYIFQSINGDIISNSQFTRMWDKFKQETGIVCTPHQLRHSYATILFDAGVDVKTAQLWLGHKDINTTLAIYTHLSENMLKNTTSKFKDFLSKNYE